MFRSMLAVAIGVSAVAVQAQPVPANPAKPAVAPVKEKKICRTEESTGSIMIKRICRTQAEWDAMSQVNRGVTGDLSDQQQRQQMMSGASNR